jgi:Protein of unknown function (DUF1631)
VKRHTGDHVARRAAANTEPSPITALRDMLATAFAADIAAVTPMVCDVLREEIRATAMPARRDLARTALVVLARNSGALATQVAQEFRVRFDMKLRAAPDSTSKARLPSDPDLTLMDETLLEIDLELDRCAARLKEQTSAEVFQLTARVAAMLGKPSLEDAENPIAPHVFARTLMQALGTMDLGSEQRLAVFRAFGPALLHIAPDLYSHANGLLAERGVLADFKARYGRPLNPQPATRPRRPEPILAGERTLATILDRLLRGERARGRETAERASAAF